MLTRHGKKAIYYKEYAILIGTVMPVSDEPKFYNAVMKIGGKTVTFCNYEAFKSFIVSIENVVKEEYKAHPKCEKCFPRFVIFTNKLFKKTYELKSEYIDFRPMDKICPTYKSHLYKLDDIDELKHKLDDTDIVINKMMKTIGPSKYIAEFKTKDDSIFEVSMAYASRRYLEIMYPDYVNTKNAYMVRDKAPKVNFLEHYITPVKQYNANKLLAVEPELMQHYVEDVVKIDRDSAFWAVPLLHKTCAYPTKVDLDTSSSWELRRIFNNPDSAFFAKIAFKKQVLLKDGVKIDWLRNFNVDLTGIVTISHIEWQDIVQYYDISFDDIVIKELYKLVVCEFPSHIKKLYRQLHKDKSIAKKNNDIATKTVIKLIANTNHGYALDNRYTNQQDYDVYKRRYMNKNKNNKGTRADYAPGDLLLTPIDALMFYNYTRSHLLKIINLTDKLYNYDTDSVTCNNADEVMEKYNTYIEELYHKNNLNVEDYTDEGYTIGKLYVEAYCDAFYLYCPKFYLWVENDKLEGKTAGYAEGSIVKTIQDVSKNSGKDALKWFVSVPYGFELDVGYQPSMSDEDLILIRTKFIKEKSDYV